MLPPPRPLSPSPGGRLALADIVGRDADAERIWRAVTESTASVLITAPRRIGKTLTLERVCAAPPPGWSASHRSYQGVGTLVGMADILLGELASHQHLGHRLRDHLRQFLDGGVAGTYEGVGLTLAVPFRQDPVAAMTSVLQAVDRHLGDDEHLLLVCDEAPDMIAAIAENEGTAAARRALGVFRALREVRGGADRPPAVRWLLTGSVGFHHVWRLVGGKDDLGNDLHPVALGPLGPDWAEWLAASVLLGAGLAGPDPELARRLATESDGFAMIIHMVGARIRDQQLGDVTTEDVIPLLDAVFADLDASHQMTSFLARLPTFYREDAPLAYRLLDRLAASPADRATLLADEPGWPVPDGEEHLRNVLDRLTRDHYLEVDDTGPHRTYRWRYPALRRLWQARRR